VDERVQEHGLNRGTKKETGLGLDQADRHATDHHDHSADATIHCIFIEHWSVRNDRRYLQKKGSGSTHGAYGLRLAAERVTTIVMIPSFAVCISSVPHAFSGENWEMTWRHEHGVEVSLCADCQIGLSFYRRAVSILHSCTGTWNQPGRSAQVLAGPTKGLPYTVCWDLAGLIISVSRLGFNNCSSRFPDFWEELHLNEILRLFGATPSSAFSQCERHVYRLQNSLRSANLS
jgi:hypothetical protein